MILPYEQEDNSKQKTKNHKQSTLAQRIAEVKIGKLQSFIDNYCNFDSDGYALINLDKFKERLKNAGVMVILTNVA